MINNDIIKLFKKFVDISILDNAENEADVEKYLVDVLWYKVSDYYETNVGVDSDKLIWLDDEFTGNYSSCAEVAWFIVPNINIINEAYKKWNETPLFVGKKWIVSHLCEDLNVFSDLDSYNINLGYFKSNDKTYQYYKDIFGDSTLNKSEYEDYDELLCEPKRKKSNKVIDDDELNDLLKRVRNKWDNEDNRSKIINFFNNLMS